MCVVISRCLLVVILPVFLAGCGASFPGFSAIEQPYLYDLPVSSVTTQVQCEIREFLLAQLQVQQELLRKAAAEKDPEQKRRLLQDRLQRDGEFISTSTPIKVDLQLQTDFNGSVQYVGVDFSKAGLDSIAKLIAQSNGKPSLGTKIQGKKTVSATFSSQFNLKDIFNKDKKDKDGKPPDFEHCTHHQVETSNPMRRLSLNQWLTNYFEAMNRDMSMERTGDSKSSEFAAASITQVKLSTQFQIGVDVAFGTNPFFPHPFVIIPFTGLNLDFNPSVSHKLEITLPMCVAGGGKQCYLAPRGGHKDLPPKELKCELAGKTLSCALPSAKLPDPKDKQGKPDVSNVSADVANRSRLRTAAVATP